MNTSQTLNFDEVLDQNLNLIRNISLKFAKRNSSNLMDYDDFFQEACLATLNAYRQYDKERGAWSTYLTKVISNHLTLVALKNISSLSAPAGAVMQSLKISSLEEAGESESNIQIILQISSDRLKEIKQIISKSILMDTPQTNIYSYSIINDIKHLLDSDEQLLFQWYLNGDDIKLIAAKLNCRYESARLKINKLFNKIKKSYE